jgi:hypothetical protein
MFLTYPQCQLEPTDALEQLRAAIAKMGSRSISEYIVAQEDHKDGHKHLHAYIQVDKKVDVTRPNALDLTDAEGKQYHGNYQGVKSDEAVIKYVTKGGNFIASKDLETL